MEALDIPDVRQKDGSSCGLACFRAVLEYYDIQEQQGLTHPDGLKPGEIEALARAHGMECRQLTGMDALGRQLNQGRPVICPIQAGDPDSLKNGHYVVVRGFDDGKVQVHDPIDGPQEIESAAFLDRWHDVDRDGAEYKQFGLSCWRAGTMESMEAAGTCKPGERADLTGCAPATEDGKAKDSPTDHDAKAQGTLTKFKAALSKVTDAPVLKQVKQLGGVLKKKAQKFYKALEGRYGPTQAKLIMASGTALDLGVTGLSALHGVPLYIPGMSILGSLPAVAMAETYLQAKKLFSSRESEGEPPVLSPKEIAAESRRLVSELLGAHVEYLKANGLATFEAQG
jgi:peptidase C39-like protein